jgi:hypothetical protein
LRVPFAQSDVSERRIGEHAIRHEPVARAAVRSGLVVRDDAEVVDRCVRELRAAGTLTESPDIGGRRFKPVVHADVAARVQLDAGFLKPDPGRIGDAPCRDEDVASLDLFLAGRRADGEGHFAAGAAAHVQCVGGVSLSPIALKWLAAMKRMPTWRHFLPPPPINHQAVTGRGAAPF